MWTTTSLKCPDDDDWVAVIKVTPDGATTLLRYLSDAPADVEQELDSIQQRWTTRLTWPEDDVIQDGARIREYVKYPEEDPRFLGVRAQIDGQTVVLDPRDVELVYQQG